MLSSEKRILDCLRTGFGEDSGDESEVSASSEEMGFGWDFALRSWVCEFEAMLRLSHDGTQQLMPAEFGRFPEVEDQAGDISAAPKIVAVLNE